MPVNSLHSNFHKRILEPNAEITMKHLTKQATSIFNKCIDGLKEPGDHRRIGDADTGFMPLIVECVDTWGLGLIYFLALYAE